uniref:BTB domain-containing protein n=1 Tax=Meloidogyne hapla TaxID=6305 RepID=A0A1I8BDW9_MELHA
MEPVNCKIEWKIYNLKKHEEYMQENQFLTSKQFYNPKYPFVKWELRLYLDTAIKTGHLQGTCISLVQVGLKDSSNDSLKAKFIVYTLDDEDEEINVHKCVLANNSIVFKTMLEQMGMVEAQNVGKIT